MTPFTRTLFLEIDSGDKVLIRRWAEDGTLRTFRRLLDNGLVGDTKSVDGFFVGATWPSLYTGVSPARHGFHSLMQLRCGTYDFYRTKPGEDVRHEPFWSAMSRAGKRVAILDVPLSSLSDGLNGAQTVEWGVHDAVYGFRAQPESLAREILDKVGPHPIKGLCNSYGRSPQDFRMLRDDLVEGVRKKAEWTRDLLRRGEWDFFCQVFSEAHCVGHQCWHFHDEASPGHDPELARQVGDPIKDVYVALDEAVGAILSEVGDDTLVVVLAGHRMAHKYGAQLMLPEILESLGVANKAAPRQRPATKAALDSVLTAAWQQVPSSIKSGLRGLQHRTREWVTEAHLTMAPHLAALDRRTSHCFVMDNGFPVSGLRVNVIDREPQGLVRRGGELDGFCRQLTADLEALVHVDSGLRLVSRVRRTSDVYEGPYLDWLPDLLVEWNEDVRLGSATCGNPRGSVMRIDSPKTGELSAVNNYPRTGDHRPDGLFMAQGPHVSPGRMNRTVSLMDFAPTFAESVGVRLPDVDGRRIEELAPR